MSKSIFERRHYVWLASHMRDRARSDSFAYTEGMLRWIDEANALADALARESSSFDRTKFLKACGVEES